MGLLELLEKYNERTCETHYFRMFSDGSGCVYKGLDTIVFSFQDPAELVSILSEEARVKKVYL